MMKGTGLDFFNFDTPTNFYYLLIFSPHFKNVAIYSMNLTLAKTETCAAFGQQNLRKDVTGSIMCLNRIVVYQIRFILNDFPFGFRKFLFYLFICCLMFVMYFDTLLLTYLKNFCHALR